MEMPEFHQRIFDASQGVCDRYGLVLAGGYGMRAHGLVDRPSRDLDFAVCSSTPLSEITEALADSYRDSGFTVEHQRNSDLLARLIVSEALLTVEQSCAVDLMKLPLQRPPVILEIGPVASVDDMIGMKVGAVHGRGLPRDLIDVASVADRYSFVELERLGRLLDQELRREQLAYNLEQAMSLEEERFTAYGLDREAVQRLRQFMLAWYDDLSMRLAEEAHLAIGMPEVQHTGYPDT